MKTIADPREMQNAAELHRRAGKRIAVVPTMGAFHEGHLALIRDARKRGEVLIVTLFVNPVQFGKGEDFERYPRDLERDTALAQEAGADFLFVPQAAEMYPEGYQTYVTVERVARPLEGTVRPGHFRGVATVVVKLFNITMPHIAVFGQKDAQQVAVIRRMVRDLNLGVELVVLPTVRDADGLALSSRNAYLTAEQRCDAPALYAALQHAGAMVTRGERSAPVIVAAMRAMLRERTAAVIDYCSVADAETLEEFEFIPAGRQVLISLAARFGTTRLIDNIPLTT
ncbi:MAG: pantoate--beta-alanine ligase [Bacteroidota bacterium]